MTPIRCGANAWAHQDVRNRDVVCWPTSLGWMMGPWLVFAALLNGAAIALFNGAPLARPFGEFVDAARVTMLGVVPSIVRAWRGSDCMQVPPPPPSPPPPPRCGRRPSPPPKTFSLHARHMLLAFMVWTGLCAHVFIWQLLQFPRPAHPFTSQA